MEDYQVEVKCALVKQEEQGPICSRRFTHK